MNRNDIIDTLGKHLTLWQLDIIERAIECNDDDAAPLIAAWRRSLPLDPNTVDSAFLAALEAGHLQEGTWQDVEGGVEGGQVVHSDGRTIIVWFESTAVGPCDWGWSWRTLNENAGEDDGCEESGGIDSLEELRTLLGL